MSNRDVKDQIDAGYRLPKSRDTPANMYQVFCWVGYISTPDISTPDISTPDISTPDNCTPGILGSKSGVEMSNFGNNVGHLDPQLFSIYT